MGSHSRKFQDSWLKDKEFKGWVRKIKDDNTKYRCTVCSKKTRAFSTAGGSALTEHAEGEVF